MIIRSALISFGLITGWLCIALLTMVSGTIATAAVPKGTILPKNVAIIDSSGPLLIIRSDDPDFVRELYRNGAPFVLPARKKTCLELQSLGRSS